MNPFFETYTTPFEVPPFDKILNAHYLPAFQEGMKQHDTEIEQIASNQATPDFENTIEALDRSGDLLRRVSTVFFNVKEANTNDSINAIAEEIAPQLSQHNDAIVLNEALFARVKAVYDQKENLQLNTEQARLLEETFKNFVRGGANLPVDKKEELKKVNEQLSLLDLKFDKNLLAETNSFKLVVDNKDDLAGLPENVVGAAAEEAKAAEWKVNGFSHCKNPAGFRLLLIQKNAICAKRFIKPCICVATTTTNLITSRLLTSLLTCVCKKRIF